jgi:tetratricopeptide (TPR) repeat protein
MAEPPARPSFSSEIDFVTEASLRIEEETSEERGTSSHWKSGPSAKVMIGLTPDALWIQETWQLRRFPLRMFGSTEALRNGRVLILKFLTERFTQRLWLIFGGAEQGEYWHREVKERQAKIGSNAPLNTRIVPEGVALVRKAPKVPHENLGRIEIVGTSRWAADRGLQLRAGIRGADALIHYYRRGYRELGFRACQVSGEAIRVEDADARARLRLIWYAEDVSALVKRMLLLLTLQGGLLFFTAAISPQIPTGETGSEAFRTSGLWLGLFFFWPVVLVVLLWVIRWPQLLRPVGLAVLAATTGRGVTVWLAHFGAALASGTPAAESNLGILVDPFNWAFVLAGIVLWLRAWRLARDAPQILPYGVHVASTGRRIWACGLLAGSGVYALAFCGFAGYSRYQISSYLLEPGVDPRREQQARLAMNEGAAFFNRGELGPAEQSMQRALKLWEELTTRRSSPSIYRANLAVTLNNMGLIRLRQDRTDQAEPFFARAVDLADQLAGDPKMDDNFKKTMADARGALAEIRSDKAFLGLEEKEKTAFRKFEDAEVKADKGDITAETLYQEAVALWEEVLPKAINPKYKVYATTRLASAFLMLAEFQQRLGKRSEAESNFQKSIDYGEKAVALDPDRHLISHNLEVARQRLEELREQTFFDEVSKLCDAQRFADAVDHCLRGIEDLEEQVHSGKAFDPAGRRLAYRLDRFAWLLGQCPDERTRDTKAAVKHARRATQLQPDVGDYWYTFAMVQYRNGDWRDSLVSLEKVKDKEKGYDASAWLLVAMNRHQLKQREEARAALRKAVEWIEEQQREAEGNALLRIRLEMSRPAIESLRREAESLIEGKDPTNRTIGRADLDPISWLSVGLNGHRHFLEFVSQASIHHS